MKVESGWRFWPKKFAVQVLCKDPSFARAQKIAPIKLEFEDEEYLGPGPTSRRVAVVDYNQQLDVVFAPASPAANGEGFVTGPSRDFVENAKLRQVAVWGIVNRTLRMLESPRMLGRPIPWASAEGRLLVLPHAGPGENAFYDRATGALHFLYFEGQKGERVFTCLSHDIVTHELGHAVLDGLKPCYSEVTSPETAAFHEYFGDALAITASLGIRELLAAVVGARKATKLDDVLGEIGAEFGSARGPTPFLRSAAKPHPLSTIADRFEEHALSEVLTSTFFEHLRRRYPRELTAARRRYPGPLSGGHAVRALINATSDTSQLYLRALDYCSPVEASFADYARAVLKVAAIAYPPGTKPEVGELARAIFARRGIVPAPEIELRNRALRKGYDVDRLSATTGDAMQFLDANRRVLQIPMRANVRVKSVYRTRKEAISGFQSEEVVLEFVWTEEVPLRGRAFGSLDKTRATLYCGGTLVFDRTGNVLHYVLADGTAARRDTLRAYIEYLVRERRLGLSERGFGAAAAERYAVQAAIDGDRLTLRRTAALRHQGRRAE